MKIREVKNFKDSAGKEPFNEWFNSLSDKCQVKVDAYLARMLVRGSKKNIKSLKDGVYELRIDYGPGLRIYFGETKDIVLLLGGDKGSQKRDVKRAKLYWNAYKIYM